MKYLFIDLETSGSDVSECHITEIGYIVYNTKFKEVTKSASVIINEGDDIKTGLEVQEITGISDEMRKEEGLPLRPVLIKLLKVIKEVNFVFAHNAFAFDRCVLIRKYREYGLDLDGYTFNNWVDTLHDITYPSSCKYKNLTYLCGYFNIQSGGHRALFDAIALMKLVLMFDMNSLIDFIITPMKIVKFYNIHDFEYIKGLSKLMHKHIYTMDGSYGLAMRDLSVSQLKRFNPNVCDFISFDFDEYNNSDIKTISIKDSNYKDKNLIKKYMFKWHNNHWQRPIRLIELDYVKDDLKDEDFTIDIDD